MCVGYMSKGSVILVRACVLYVVNLTIMSLRIYYFEHKPSVFVVDSCGRCCQDIEVHDDSTDKVWKCSSKCKPY